MQLMPVTVIQYEHVIVLQYQHVFVVQYQEQENVGRTEHYVLMLSFACMSIYDHTISMFIRH